MRRGTLLTFSHGSNVRVKLCALSIKRCWHHIEYRRWSLVEELFWFGVKGQSQIWPHTKRYAILCIALATFIMWIRQNFRWRTSRGILGQPRFGNFEMFLSTAPVLMTVLQVDKGLNLIFESSTSLLAESSSFNCSSEIPVFYCYLRWKEKEQP